jgi:hypothetical protein
MTTLPCEILRRGRNAFVTVKGPKALTSKTFLTVSVSIHSIKPRFEMPALLTTAHSAKMKKMLLILEEDNILSVKLKLNGDLSSVLNK